MFNAGGKPAQAITVLLVEDNPRDAALVFRALGDRVPRFEVSTVGTLADALISLNGSSFDVILLDIVLPDSEGFATIAAVRKAAPAIPLIVLTGFADNDMAVAAVEAGIQDFLIKGDFEIAMIERMGGEEFTIVLPETGGNEAMLVADRIRLGIAGIRCDSDTTGLDFGLTVSIGVAECSVHETRIEQPLARADRALYEAKAAGRNRVLLG